jgi:hypothetical protein
MQRRQLMTALAVVFGCAVGPTGAFAAQRDADAVTFVRRLVQREIFRQAKDIPPDDARFFSLFTRDVRRLLESPVPPRPDIPLGPKLHAFLGRGVLPGWEVVLMDVTPTPGTAIAVDLTVRGARRRILVEPVREDGEWRVANISYGEGEDYVTFHRRLRGQ